MKKFIFTLIALAIIQFTQAQITYYWVGGTAGIWTDANSWSSTLGGAGGARTAPLASDILVFNGSNIGASATGTVTVQPNTETIGQLKLETAADVVFSRTSAAGTTILTIGGEAGTDLLVPANSKLTLNGVAGNHIELTLDVSATGEVGGEVLILGAGLNKMVVKGTNTLQFLSGSTGTVNSGTNPFSSTSSGTPSIDRAVMFQNGSSMVFKGGSNPFGGASTNIIQFSPGSMLIFEAANTTNMFSSRILSNVTVRANATVTAYENFYNIDNLTIEPGSTFSLRGSGTAPFSGNIINNGTFGATPTVSSSNIVMYGNSPQTIGGTGVFSDLGALSIATNANVTVTRSLVLVGTTSSTVTGKLNMQNNTLTGTNNWNGKAASTTNFTATTTAGSQEVTASSVFSGIGIGSEVSGPGIPSGSIIIATNLGNAPGGSFTISKPATASGTLVALVGMNTSPTLQLANTGGVDATIATTGSRIFGAGTNYIFDAATVTPFSMSSVTAAGNVTFNAPSSLNRSVDIGGTLTLNGGKLTIPPSIAARLTSGTPIAGGPFSSSKYIVTQVNTTTGDQAGLRIDGFTAPTLFPVGSPNHYLPITLDPMTASDFTVAVFEGITNEGNPQGTPMPAAQKAEVVDAVWTINRNSANSDACQLTLNWVPELEGSVFATFSDAHIGMARHNGTAWGTTGGSGNNTANFVTNTFSSFSPFGVGRNGFVLPLKFTNFNAALTNNKVAVKWEIQNEAGIDRYVVERSANGTEFSAIGTVAASNLRSYSHIDAMPLNGANFYRVRSVATDGQLKYTGIVRIATGRANADITLSPNPVRGNQFIVNMAGFTKANYSLTLLNAAGQKVYSMNLGQVDGAASNSIQLPAGIQKGMYTVMIHSNELQLQKVIILQ